LQGIYQAVGLAHHSRARFVSGEFSLPRKTELQQHCPEGRKKK